MTPGQSPPMRAIQRWTLRYWPRHREKAMYLVVGGWNTLFAYGCFSLLYYLLHEGMAPSAILAIAYMISSLNGFLTFRYLVFEPVTHLVIEYLKYQAVYLPIIALNLAILPLALKYSDLNAYSIQALFAIFAVTAAYLGNKYFAFRKPKARD
jgi:putative flippase GtrA